MSQNIAISTKSCTPSKDPGQDGHLPCLTGAASNSLFKCAWVIQYVSSTIYFLQTAKARVILRVRRIAQGFHWTTLISQPPVSSESSLLCPGSSPRVHSISYALQCSYAIKASRYIYSQRKLVENLCMYCTFFPFG